MRLDVTFNEPYQVDSSTDQRSHGSCQVSLSLSLSSFDHWPPSIPVVDLVDPCFWSFSVPHLPSTFSPVGFHVNASITTVTIWFVFDELQFSLSLSLVQFDPCLHARLGEYGIDQWNMDAIVNHQLIQYGEIASLPFTGTWVEREKRDEGDGLLLPVGNGYLALSLSTHADIQLIPDTNSSFLSSGYSPLIDISSKRSDDTRATVLHMKEGYLRRFQCVPMLDRRFAHVSHRLYVHRRRPSLIVQDIEIVNPSDESLVLNLRTKHAKQQEMKLDSHKETFLLTTDRISLRQHRSIVFVVLTSQLLLESPVKPQRYPFPQFTRSVHCWVFGTLVKLIKRFSLLSNLLPSSLMHLCWTAPIWNTGRRHCRKKRPTIFFKRCRSRRRNSSTNIDRHGDRSGRVASPSVDLSRHQRWMAMWSIERSITFSVLHQLHSTNRRSTIWNEKNWIKVSFASIDAMKVIRHCKMDLLSD